MTEQDYFLQFSGEIEDELTIKNILYANLFAYDIKNGIRSHTDEYFQLIEETKRKRDAGEKWEKIE